jgi:hypothetical protein
MYPVRPDEFLLITRGTPVHPGDSGVLFMLGHVIAGTLYVAPMGSPQFTPRAHRPPWNPWQEIGPISDLPSDHYLGDIAGAFRRAVAACN